MQAMKCASVQRAVCLSGMVLLMTVFSGSAGKKSEVQAYEAMKQALQKFDTSLTDLDPFVKKSATSQKSPYLVLANVLLSLAEFSTQDTFRRSIQYACDAAYAAEKSNKIVQDSAFFIKPTIEYYRLLAPNGDQLATLKKNTHLIVPYATVIYHHAHTFYLLKLRNYLLEASNCFSIFNQEFYTSIPEIKKMADDIKLWSIQLNEDSVSD
jgi:hypothetical protein